MIAKQQLQRDFKCTQCKINGCLYRKGAAEVRKQVSSAYLNDLPKSISGINLAAGHNVSTTGMIA